MAPFAPFYLFPPIPVIDQIHLTIKRSQNNQAVPDHTRHLERKKKKNDIFLKESGKIYPGTMVQTTETVVQTS